MFDDDRVVAGEVLHPPAESLEAGRRHLVEGDGALSGLGACLVDHLPGQEAVELTPDMAHRRRPVEVSDRELGAEFDFPAVSCSSLAANTPKTR